MFGAHSEYVVLIVFESFSKYANPHLGRTWLVPLECHFSDNLRIYIDMVANECHEKYIKTQKTMNPIKIIKDVFIYFIFISCLVPCLRRVSHSASA
jgi:hypothetical protein